MNRKFLSGGIVVAAVLLGFWGMSNVAETSTVSVAATVATAITCNTSTSSIAFGTLSSAAVASTSAIGSASTSLSCNTGLGCTLTIQDQGNGASPGLATTSPAYLIPSADGTMSAGTENYGVKATSTTEGSGGAIKVDPKYSSLTYGTVGGLLRAATTIASSTAQISSRSVLVSHWAAISGTTQAGIYNDTITYSCTGN